MPSINDLGDSELKTILMTGFLLSTIFIILGILIYRYKYYNLIAGYNQAPEHIKKQYDIEGLAKHIGNGLITLGVLLILGTIFLYFNLLTLFTVTFLIFLFIVFIMLLGSVKFMPYTQYLTNKSPSDARHHFLHRMLPAKVYRALGIADINRITGKRVMFATRHMENQLSSSGVKIVRSSDFIKFVKKLTLKQTGL